MPFKLYIYVKCISTTVKENNLLRRKIRVLFKMTMLSFLACTIPNDVWNGLSFIQSKNAVRVVNLGNDGRSLGATIVLDFTEFQCNLDQICQCI